MLVNHIKLRDIPSQKNHSIIDKSTEGKSINTIKTAIQKAKEHDVKSNEKEPV